MKKAIVITLILGSFLLTSCSSGWSCKNRYVKIDKKHNTIENKNNA
jgi:PBP1b-binding outer membrane lipoprotein LpoB